MWVDGRTAAAKMLRTNIDIQRNEGEKEDVPNRSRSWESKARFTNIQGCTRSAYTRKRRGRGVNDDEVGGSGPHFAKCNLILT